MATGMTFGLAVGSPCRAAQASADAAATTYEPPLAATMLAGGDEEWLAPSARIGRNELQVSRFHDPRPPQDLIADIVDRWGRRSGPLQHTREGPWEVLVHLDGSWAETVRLLAHAHGTVGLRIRQRVIAAADDDGDPMRPDRWLEGARVVNRTEQRDGGRRSVSWVAVSAMAPQTLLVRLRHAAADQGYVAVAGGPAPAAAAVAGATIGAAGQSTLLWMRRKADEVVLTVTPHDSGSVAILHWSRSR